MRGNGCCDHAHPKHDGDRRNDRRRVDGGQAEQKTLKVACEREGTGKADCTPDREEDQSFVEYGSSDIGGAGSDCQTYPYLACPAGNGIGHEPEESHHRYE